MTLDEPSPEAASTRRGMLLGVGLVGLAGTLTACGGSKDDSGSAASPPPGNGRSAPANAGGDALAKTGEIPVGGGKIFKDEKVVVTQPKQGEFEAFSAVCQHRGCTVGSIAGDKIICPCHGSAYNVSDGGVANGPTTKPLPRKNIKVQNGEITLA